MEMPVQPLTRHNSRRLSQSMIVDQALAILQTEGLEAFSMPRLGRELGVSSMAVYRHFANRDAILHAVLGRIVATFDFQPDEADWETSITRWFNAVFHMFKQNPAALHLQKWNENDVAGAWLEIWAPLVGILGRMGFRQDRLALVFSWISTVTLGAATVHLTPKARPRPTIFKHASGDPALDVLIAEVDRSFDTLTSRQVIAFAVDGVVDQLRRLSDGLAALTHPTA